MGKGNSLVKRRKGSSGVSVWRIVGVAALALFAAGSSRSFPTSSAT